MRLDVGPRRGAVDGEASFGPRQGRPRWLPLLLILAGVGGAALLAGCEADPTPPDTALLKAQPPPKCDARSKGAKQKQSADADGEAARLSQLDYEAQCYRHAEMIARGRLSRLQDSVRAAKAAKKEPAETP